MHLFEAAVVPVSQLSAGRISAVWSLEPSLTAKSTKFGEIFTRPLNHSRKTDADIGGLIIGWHQHGKLRGENCGYTFILRYVSRFSASSASFRKIGTRSWSQV